MSALPLRVVAQTSTTITLAWEPVPGARGYRLSREKGAGRYSHTWDGARSQARFARDSDWYKVEALSIPAVGVFPGVNERKGYASGGSLPGLSAESRAEELNSMAAAGARWCRIDLPWSGIEPAQGQYDFAPYDRAVAEIRARGMKVLGCAAYFPSWANGGYSDDKFPPLDASDYGRFIAALANRYDAGDVAAIELGNEPNIQGFWKTGLVERGPETLADMAKAARAAAPDRFLVSAGLSPSVSNAFNLDPRAYFLRFCAAGGGAAVDAVGFHPYYGPCPVEMVKDWSAWSQMHVPQGTPGQGDYAGTMSLPSLRETMTAYGLDDKTIWATECNMVVSPDNGIDGFEATEARQAELVEEAFAAWCSYDWAGVFCLYNFQSDYPRYSLRRPDGSLRETYTRYAAL
jgi:hypothetical protein